MSKGGIAGPFGYVNKLLGPAARNRALRRRADAARDAGDWSQAAELYRAYLNRMPSDAPIWVQYGHAAKEAGDFATAESAYSRAIMLRPDDADPRLHFAHLLKTRGRMPEAAQLFSDLFKLMPTAETFEALRAAGLAAPTGYLATRPAGVGSNAILIELRDLLQYLSLHETVTGITRVTLSLLNYVLYEMDAKRSSQYHFVQQNGDAEGLMLLDRERIRKLVNQAMHDTKGVASMQKLIHEIRSQALLFEPERGDTYLIVGAFWEFVANPSWIGGMRNKGVIVGSFIYDLIPITYPQYCVASLTTAFTLAFSETARLLNFALSISQFVADDVRQYLARRGVDAFPIIPVPLAHELQFEDRSTLSGAGGAGLGAGIARMFDTPYVLCVCTIEARKNHEYLVEIWRRLLAEGIDMPELVFVGRPGWRVERLMADLQLSRYLDGRIHIIHGLSDAELDALYEGCLFTVFPSFVEGWGLPVGESLTHGKPCVASNASSIPEVGGDFSIYIDPLDVEDGYRVIRELVGEPGRIAELSARIRRDFRARTWSDVGREFFAGVESLVAAEQAIGGGTVFVPSLASGKMLDVASLGAVSSARPDYIRNPQRLMFATGWRGVEVSGTWLQASHGELKLQTDLESGDDVAVLLHFDTSSWVNFKNVLTISVGSGGVSGQRSYRRPLQPDAPTWTTVEGSVGDGGVLTVNLDVTGEITTGTGHAPVAVRLFSIGYTRRDDWEKRVKLLEGALNEAIDTATRNALVAADHKKQLDG